MLCAPFSAKRAKICQTRQKEQKGQKWCKVAKSCPQCLWIVFPWECPQNQGFQCPIWAWWLENNVVIVSSPLVEVPSLHPFFRGSATLCSVQLHPIFLEFSTNLLEFFSLHSNRRFYITRWYIQDRNMHANKAQNPANTAENPAKKRKSTFLPWRTLKVVAKPQNSMRNCHRIWCVPKMNSSEDSEVCHYSWYSWRLAGKDHNRSCLKTQKILSPLFAAQHARCRNIYICTCNSWRSYSDMGIGRGRKKIRPRQKIYIYIYILCFPGQNHEMWTVDGPSMWCNWSRQHAWFFSRCRKTKGNNGKHLPM